MIGGDTKYEDRGMIPRSLEFLFAEVKDRKDYSYEVNRNVPYDREIDLSFVEIYNGEAYDLKSKMKEKRAKLFPQESKDGVKSIFLIIFDRN